MDTKAFRQSLNVYKNYHRTGFGHEAEAVDLLSVDYKYQLIQEIRENGYILQRGDVTIRLAEVFGFCWGVERAVAMAYETRLHFPQQRIWITGEIIHNPSVNQKLRDMQIEFIPVKKGQKDFLSIAAEDVVIIPGAGATVQEMQLLREKGCKIVDTTCPWVAKVWNSVEKHKKGNYTSIIHGKHNHDETIATSSFAAKYLIVENLAEAQTVCDYILNGGNCNKFMAKFGNACSPGFAPNKDLERVGIANQTTMLKSETEQIGKLFERIMMKKYGLTNLNDHFLPFNTICNATQERQDAMSKLLEEKLDLMVVVGGFNSANTTHLHQMAIARGIPSYHIDSAERIGSVNRVQHKPLNRELEVTENWLPLGPIVLGITSGASTPDRLVADVLQKIFQFKTTADSKTVGQPILGVKFDRKVPLSNS